VVKNNAVLPRADRYVDVAIIGAGFSGSMVAVHLAHTLRCAREIALIEKQRRTGPGIAYSTDNPLHLLNVSAGKMSAYPEKPSHFLEWLKQHPELLRQHRLESLTEETFVPRSLFGLYVQLLVQRCAIRSGHVHRFEREAVDLVKASDGSFRVILADNTTTLENGFAPSKRNRNSLQSTCHSGDPFCWFGIARGSRKSSEALGGEGESCHRGRVVWQRPFYQLRRSKGFC
jgi:hypothetical protein